MRRRNLLQPVTYQREHRELAAARKAAFAEQPSQLHQVWQLDFSEYETTTGGVWRLAGCADYYSKYEFGWHTSRSTTAADAITAVELAIGEAERLHQRSLLQQQTNPDTGEVRSITLVTDNGAAFTSARFERFLRSRPELSHVRTRANTPGQKGVRERAFGSLKYEHLYRLEIADGQTLATEAEQYRQVFNHTRPPRYARPPPTSRHPPRRPTDKSTNRVKLSHIFDTGHKAPVSRRKRTGVLAVHCHTFRQTPTPLTRRRRGRTLVLVCTAPANEARRDDHSGWMHILRTVPSYPTDTTSSGFPCCHMSSHR